MFAERPSTMATTIFALQPHAQHKPVFANAARIKVIQNAQDLGLQQSRPCSQHVRFRVRHVARNLWVHVNVTADGSVQDLLDLSLVACDLLSASAVQTVTCGKPRSDTEKRDRENTSPSNLTQDFAVNQQTNMQEKLVRMRKAAQTELDDNIVRELRQSMHRSPSNVRKRRHSSFVPLSLNRSPPFPIRVKPARSFRGTLVTSSETDYFFGKTTPGQRKRQNNRISHHDYPLRQDQNPSYHPTAWNNFSPLAMRLQHFFSGRKRNVTLGSPKGDRNGLGFQDSYKEVETARTEYAIFWVNGGHWVDEYRTIESYNFDAENDLFELHYRGRYIPIDYSKFLLGENYAEGYLRELPECWNESLQSPLGDPAFMSTTASFSKIPIWSPNAPCCYVGYKKRWCVLRDCQLHCFKKKKDTSILQSYDLSGLVTVTTPSLNEVNSGLLRTSLMPADTPNGIAEQTQSPAFLVLVLGISDPSSSSENHATATACIKSLTLQAETVKDFEHWNRIFKSLINGSPEPSNRASPASTAIDLPVKSSTISTFVDTKNDAIPLSVQRSSSLGVRGKFNNCRYKLKYNTLPSEKRNPLANHTATSTITNAMKSARKTAIAKDDTLRMNMTENNSVSCVLPDRNIGKCLPSHIVRISCQMGPIPPGLGIRLHHPQTPPPLPSRPTNERLPVMASSTGTPTPPITHSTPWSKIPPCVLPDLRNGDDSTFVFPGELSKRSPNNNCQGDSLQLLDTEVLPSKSPLPVSPTSSISYLHRLTSRSSSSSQLFNSHILPQKPTQSTSPSFSASQRVSRFARSLAKAANRKSVHLPFRHGFRNDATAGKTERQPHRPCSDRSSSIDDNTLIESPVPSEVIVDDYKAQQNHVLDEESGDQSFQLALPSRAHQPEKLATPVEEKGVFGEEEQDEISIMPSISKTKTRQKTLIFAGIVDHDMDSRIRALMMNEIAWLDEDLGSTLNSEANADHKM